MQQHISCNQRQQTVPHNNNQHFNSLYQGSGNGRANYYQQNDHNNNPDRTRRTQILPREPAQEQQGHEAHSEIHYYQNQNPCGVSKEVLYEQLNQQAHEVQSGIQNDQ
jgi:hypothetical protein